MSTANQKKQPVQEEKVEASKEKKHAPSKRNWLYESLDLSRWVHHQTIIRNLPFVFFLSTVAIVYIANSHYAEKNIRELNLIERKMNEMRWEYMTTKSELENISKQSEVARLVEASGLKELSVPPKKITTKKDEH